MLMIVGLLLAIGLAGVMMKLVGWLRANKGWELSRTAGFWSGLGVVLLLFTVFRYTTGLPNEIISGIAIGIGVGISQGFGGPAKPR
ncbi:MAG TPA: hypothetical protein VNT26_15400 [Candidatus Sulfotelmatobacter sp.]|nr:hypothetical protein [Candidatus Sulfotelmatobacter sp.]